MLKAVRTPVNLRPTNSRQQGLANAGFFLGNDPMVPVIDLQSPNAAADIGNACRAHGFFYVVNHGVSEKLQADLADMSRKFFREPLADKMKMEMALGGKAWRGYFPVGGELTSGKPDQKEGIYFGEESAPSSKPLHGPNLFPAHLPEMRGIVLDYIAAMTKLSHELMRLISISLGLPENYFYDHYTAQPLLLFRIFNYPPPSDRTLWGVGEHTDYGVLTILKQDDLGGLEIRTGGGWVPAPPLANSFVCNIGDMLDRMTKGLYRSTPHRVKNSSGKNRLSFPFFFDPNFDAEVKPLPIANPAFSDDEKERWDRQSVHTFRGTYGEYLLRKVGKVFPLLKDQVLK